LEEVNCYPEEEDSEAVIEKPENEDAVESFREYKQWEDV